MRSIIEEIASAEQQAQELTKNAAAQSRERLVQAREQAERALALADAEERKKTELALQQAGERGEATEKETLVGMAEQADELCEKAKSRVDGAVKYLVGKVQSRA